LDKQEKETGPQGCGTNLQGCGQVFAKGVPSGRHSKELSAGMRDEPAGMWVVDTKEDSYPQDCHSGHIPSGPKTKNYKLTAP